MGFDRGGDRQAMGARVIAAAGGMEKLAVARSRGGDELIDYRKESIRDWVRALTGGKGADVVYDPVGGDAFDQAVCAINWEARMLVIGFAEGSGAVSWDRGPIAEAPPFTARATCTRDADSPRFSLQRMKW
jgi:NADPH:quinone reductase-like Zn-dependent oxidoreductase